MHEIPIRADISTRPEVELLLACARTTISSENAKYIKQIAQRQPDWDFIYQLATRHRVTPLLYHSLSSIAAEAVPAALLGKLRDDYRESANYGLLLTAELVKLLDRLRAHNIEAIPWKGPALAQVAYGNLSLRQFDDLDILVHKRDILRARDIMIACDYVSDWGAGSQRECAYLKSEHAYPFVHARSDISVELHFQVRERYFAFPLNPEELWKHARPICLGGKQVSNLAIEDLLLILCVHGATHCWERLSWICDIAELVRRYPELDWERLLRRATLLGSRRIVLLALLLARRLFDLTLPAEVLRQLHVEEVIQHLASQVYNNLFHVDTSSPVLSDRTYFHLQVRERWRDRLRYCYFVTVTSNEEDWSLVRLPASLSFVYSLIRPFRLLGTYGLRPLRRRLTHAISSAE
jgi:hypothetical protein